MFTTAETLRPAPRVVPLSFLTQLPVDLVKIDGSFIQDLPGSQPLQAIVKGLVQTCRQLGILTAAEHVQDDETLAILRSYGVDFGQGFHIGEPESMVPTKRPARSIELEIHSATERGRPADETGQFRDRAAPG